MAATPRSPTIHQFTASIRNTLNYLVSKKSIDRVDTLSKMLAAPLFTVRLAVIRLQKYLIVPSATTLIQIDHDGPLHLYEY